MISHVCNAPLRKILLVLACISITAGCAGFERQIKPAAVQEIHPGILAGYLARGASQQPGAYSATAC